MTIFVVLFLTDSCLKSPTMNKYAMLLMAAAISCTPKEKNLKAQTLPSYNVSEPIVVKLDDQLTEISGITFDADAVLYAHEDESGKIYTVTESGEIEFFSSINKNDDFEDIAVADGFFYLLKSNGTLFTFPKKKDLAENEIREISNIVPKGEYEGLAYKKEDQSLYMLTKKAKNKAKGPKQLEIYRIPVKNSVVETMAETISLDTGKIAEKAGLSKLNFQPSALAFHAAEKQWYILSSINKMLVITDENWNVMDVAELDPNTYPQPEGMSFDPKGNLWIASEGNGGAGRIYQINKN